MLGKCIWLKWDYVDKWRYNNAKTVVVQILDVVFVNIKNFTAISLTVECLEVSNGYLFNDVRNKIFKIFHNRSNVAFKIES